jgi:hypothetical protein
MSSEHPKVFISYCHDSLEHHDASVTEPNFLALCQTWLLTLGKMLGVGDTASKNTVKDP